MSPISTTISSPEKKVEASMLCEQLDLNLFEDINSIIRSIKKCETDEEHCLKKIEKIERLMEEGREGLTKGKEARDVLKRRNDSLHDKLEDRESRVREAIQYWKDFAFDVKQLSPNSYEFIYSKLTESATCCSISLRLENMRLEIFKQVPEVLSPDLLAKLNDCITTRCVQDEAHVDYKLAMITIKRELIRCLKSKPIISMEPTPTNTKLNSDQHSVSLSEAVPKTFSHQSADTNNRTYT